MFEAFKKAVRVNSVVFWEDSDYESKRFGNHHAVVASVSSKPVEDDNVVAVIRWTPGSKGSGDAEVFGQAVGTIGEVQQSLLAFVGAAQIRPHPSGEQFPQ